MTVLHSGAPVGDGLTMAIHVDSGAEDDFEAGNYLNQLLTAEEELPLRGEWVAVADELDLNALARQVYERCHYIALGRHYLDHAAAEQLHSSIRQNVRNLHSILIGTAGVSEVPVTELLTFARLQAGLGVPQKDMQRSYRISYFTQWRAWQGHLAGRGAGPEVEAQVSRAVLTYQDYVATQVAEVHGAFYDALSRSRDHARQMLLRELCTGSFEPTASDWVLLGYDIDRWHRAVVLPAGDEAAAERLRRRVRTERRDAEIVSQPFATRGTELWIGLPGAWSEAADADLDGALAEAGLIASVGEPGQGLEGFRRTHQMATAVQHLRNRYRGSVPQPGVVRHRDVQLELLLLQNEAGARDLVERVLGPLAAGNEAARRLRETLLVWFRVGTLKLAAAELGYHEHTIRNRVLKAQELLGPGVRERSLELQVAVRLADYLSPEEHVGAPPPTGSTR